MHNKRTAKFALTLFFGIVLSSFPPSARSETQHSSAQQFSQIHSKVLIALEKADYTTAVIGTEQLLEVKKTLLDEQLVQVANLCGKLADSPEHEMDPAKREGFRTAGVEIIEHVWRTEPMVASPRGYGGFSPARLKAIAPFVVNTGNNGQFSADGKFSTSEIDLSNIFKNAEDTHSKWSEKSKTSVRNIVVYSHGGLVSEVKGLKTAELMLPKWLENGIYPINIVWQSGAHETIGYIKADRKARQTATNGEIATTPPENAAGMIGFSLKRAAVILPSNLVEKAARKKVAPVWLEMKSNALSISGIARRPGSPDEFLTVNNVSAGKILCDNLKKYSDAHPGEVRIHLVGHSAGSIVLSGLLQRCADAGLTVESLIFLAPAITMEDYQKLTESIFHKGMVKHVSIYNLSDNLEKRDVSAFKGFAYKRSLLYLVSRALESSSCGKEEVPLLGMAKFTLPDNHERSQILHLNGNATETTEVIISDELGSETRCAARHHGDFDNDDITIKSVVESILKLRR